ncbi:hypothetical protein JQ604_22230 [Bradyrhizobium jicamae]|uniref:hypothetical protein n=1 Tax=Bradyrhizobium jicamae TaxID=280332 RepID=UPI001BAA6D60|nr:hypothetical protein [Bradyrhizobium jicamae]MBR0754910.1 hypothetical protein [Bradyrhizobium jicamae]
MHLTSGNFVRIFLPFGQKCPKFGEGGARRWMRDRFIAEIRQEARELGLSFRVDYRKGKGGHAMVYVGDKLTTLPSREIDPKTARKIRKQLGLAE